MASGRNGRTRFKQLVEFAMIVVLCESSVRDGALRQARVRGRHGGCCDAAARDRDSVCRSRRSRQGAASGYGRMGAIVAGDLRARSGEYLRAGDSSAGGLQYACVTRRVRGTRRGRGGPPFARGCSVRSHQLAAVAASGGRPGRTNAGRAVRRSTRRATAATAAAEKLWGLPAWAAAWSAFVCVGVPNEDASCRPCGQCGVVQAVRAGRCLRAQQRVNRVRWLTRGLREALAEGDRPSDRFCPAFRSRVRGKCHVLVAARAFDAAAAMRASEARREVHVLRRHKWSAARSRGGRLQRRSPQSR